MNINVEAVVQGCKSGASPRFFFSGEGRDSEAINPSQRLMWCRIPIQNSVLAVGTQQTAKSWPLGITARSTPWLNGSMVWVYVDSEELQILNVFSEVQI